MKKKYKVYHVSESTWHYAYYNGPYMWMVHDWVPVEGEEEQQPFEKFCSIYKN